MFRRYIQGTAKLPRGNDKNQILSNILNKNITYVEKCCGLISSRVKFNIFNNKFKCNFERKKIHPPALGYKHKSDFEF